MFLGTSQTCLRVQGVFPSAGAWGSAHTFPINQLANSANQPIPLCSLWFFVFFVVKTLTALPAVAGPQSALICVIGGFIPQSYL